VTTLSFSVHVKLFYGIVSYLPIVCFEIREIRLDFIMDLYSRPDPQLAVHGATCYPTHVNAHRLNPTARQAGTLFTYHRGIEG